MPGSSFSWQTSSICTSPAYAMAAVLVGKSAGSPRWRPSVAPTSSNQKNGPTPAVRAHPSIASSRSGTSQHICM